MAKALPKSLYLNRSTPPHITTLVIISGIGAIALNVFIAALPDMARHFDVSYTVMQLAITAYLGMSGIAQLLIGPISDRYGRRPVMLGCLIIFTAASIGASYTASFEAFLAFRVIQAVIVSGLVLARTIVRDMVAREDAASMIGYVTMGMALAPMFGPPLGGFLTELYGWQSTLHFMTLTGVVVFIICWFDLGETNHHMSGSFAEQMKHYPELFKSRRFWGYAFTSAFAAATFFAYLGGSPYVGSEIYGLTSTQIGGYMMLTPLGYLLGNGISGKFTRTLGIYKMIFIGLSITLCGMLASLAAISFGTNHPLEFFFFTITIGFGNGMCLPSSNAGMLDIKPELAGSASGLGGTLMTLGGVGFTVLTSAALSAGDSAYPLALCIMLASTLALIAAFYTVGIEKQLGRT